MFFNANLFIVTFLLLWPVGTALAGETQPDDSIQPTLGENAKKLPTDKESKKKGSLSSVIEYSKRQREGKTIWIEKKLSPSTRWLENLVKPMTTWIERKIQKETLDREEKGRPAAPPKTGIERPFSSPDDSVIDSEAIALIAKERVPGQVLRIKLLNRVPLQYRVKLISRIGEIHVLYINAHTGDFILPSSESARE